MFDVELVHDWCYWWQHYWIINVNSVFSTGVETYTWMISHRDWNSEAELCSHQTPFLLTGLEWFCTNFVGKRGTTYLLNPKLILVKFIFMNMLQDSSMWTQLVWTAIGKRVPCPAWEDAAQKRRNCVSGMPEMSPGQLLTREKIKIDLAGSSLLGRNLVRIRVSQCSRK